MKLELGDFKNYIQQMLGENLELLPLKPQMVNLLPLYIAKGYEFYTTAIQNNKILLAFTETAEDYPPSRLKKEASILQNMFNLPVVYIFQSMESYRRPRLVEKKVAFIVPGKQLYIPQMVMSFIEVKEKNVPKSKQVLRPAAQCLFLYHLEVEKLSQLNFNTIAEKINYSAMTVTRAAEELEHFGLAKIEGRKERFLNFELVGKKLWDTAYKYLSTPIKISYFIPHLPKDVILLKAYDQALAEYTELSPGNQLAYAMSVEENKKIQNKLDIDYFDGSIKIEVWNYPPQTLSKTSTVDRLSLFLSLGHQYDERMRMAAKNLIEENIW